MISSLFISGTFLFFALNQSSYRIDHSEHRHENGENYKGYKALVVARNPARNIETRLTLDSSVTTITVTQNNTTKTVELNNLAAPTKVIDGDNGVALTYLNNVLTLDIPEGEALLIEF